MPVWIRLPVPNAERSAASRLPHALPGRVRHGWQIALSNSHANALRANRLDDTSAGASQPASTPTLALAPGNSSTAVVRAPDAPPAVTTVPSATAVPGAYSEADGHAERRSDPDDKPDSLPRGGLPERPAQRLPDRVGDTGGGAHSLSVGHAGIFSDADGTAASHDSRPIT